MLTITFSRHSYRSTDVTVDQSAYTLHWDVSLGKLIRLVT